MEAARPFCQDYMGRRKTDVRFGVKLVPLDARAKIGKEACAFDFADYRI